MYRIATVAHLLLLSICDNNRRCLLFGLLLGSHVYIYKCSKIPNFYVEPMIWRLMFSDVYNLHCTFPSLQWTINKFLKLTYSQAIANCIYPTYSGEQRFPTHFTVNIVIFNCITFMLTFDMVKVISSSMIATINAHRRRSRTTGDKFVRRPSCTFS